MKLTATMARSLHADLQAQLRDIERAAIAGSRDAGRGLKAELRREAWRHHRAQQHAARERGGRWPHHPPRRRPGRARTGAGGFGNSYYQHAVEIEVYVEEGDAAVRDTKFDDLLQQIGTALEADPTLGGLAFGLTYGRPEPAIEAVAGAPAIKSTTLSVVVDYEIDAPLA